MTDTVIAATTLSKRYRDVLAVDQLDLHVRAGDIYALLGLNGAGKTTLIRMLLGMIRPTAGSVTVLGAPVGSSGTGPWNSVGHLVETPAAYPELTVRQNLHLVRRLRRITARDVVDDVLERLDLTGYADRRAGALSLGNAQRLGLAKALIHRPRLLILDEPTNGLDPAGVVEIRTLLRDLADRHGTTIFLSSHLLAEVARTATRIGVIHHGRLLQQLDAAELPDRLRQRLLVSARDLPAARAALTAAGYPCEPVDGHRLAVTGPDAPRRSDDVATVLVRAGCPPTELVIDREDLERYFLRLVTEPGADR
ncbi:ABC transporter ATP-binding protein [Dactylosporangium sp. NPDC049525]|uniref:ABC transporter ATP-binding protein n=1 Tax=Dactylosporangium sp. NPDC049525 TaxID=3154730 RepID=UPI0034457C6C